MPPSLKLFASLVLIPVFYVPMCGQNSPSLGDVARQAQKDKANAPATKVLTNDDLTSGLGGGLSASGSNLGRVVQPGASAKAGSTDASPSSDLEKMKSLLNQLDSLDRDTLAKSVLQGVDNNFPGRDAWEEKMFAAKQTFVAQGRSLMKRAEQVDASSQSVKDVQNPNDPRVKDLKGKLQQLVQDGTQISAAFQAVVMEGRDLAVQSSSH